jgi:phosphoribosylglycinamide formyltransferase-1
VSKVRVAVLISGRGSNMAALIEAAEAADYPAEIVLVLSDRADAGGLAIAQQAGIPTAVVPFRSKSERGAFEAEIDRHLHDAGVSLICLAGFMRVLSAHFVEHWRDRILNIHPSLLPDFPGLDTHTRALEAKARVHGCTVHFVRAAVDAGPIVLQGQVPVRLGDTPDALAARVLEVEHQIYPLALRLVAEGRASVVGEAVEIDPGVPDYLTGPAECGHRH